MGGRASPKSDNELILRSKVRRELMKHLTPRRLNVVYEVFEFYRNI